MSEQYLSLFFGQYAMNHIKVQMGERYKQTRSKQTAKANTINKELRTLKAIMTKATEWEFLNKNHLLH